MTNKSSTDVAVSITPRTKIAEPPALNQFAPFEEMERLFERLMPKAWMPSTAWNWPVWRGLDESLQTTRIPAVDVIDRDEEILILVEVPGVDKKDLELSISDHSLNIKAPIKRPEKGEKHDYFRCEISQGDFSRMISLPTGVDTSKINASLKNGVLEIHLPKNEQIQRRSIEIK